MVVHPLESSARHPRSIRGALPSIAFHAAIVLLAVHATAHAALPHSAPATPGVIHFVPTPPAPPVVHRVTTAPERGSTPIIPARHFIAPPVAVPDHLPIPDLGSATPIVGTMEFGHGVAPVATSGTGAGTEQRATPFTVAQVDREVTPLAGSPTPAYPEPLRASGTHGSVTAEFVVDTAGKVEPGSFRALASDNDLFTNAVRTAVLRTRFRPAEAGGRRVRQLVQQRFSFTLQ